MNKVGKEAIAEEADADSRDPYILSDDDPALAVMSAADRERAVIGDYFGQELTRLLADIAKAERQIAALHARQIRSAAAYRQLCEQWDQLVGMPLVQDSDEMADEIALAKGVSRTTAGMFLGDACLLVDRHPKALAALEAGKLALTSARTIATTAYEIKDPEKLALADEVLTDEAIDLLPGQVRKMAARRVMEIDPGAFHQLAVAERSDRRIRLTPALYDMSWLTAYLPSEQAVACLDALRGHAVNALSAGDPRSDSQLMADAFVSRLTGNDTAPGGVVVNLVMTDATLLGTEDIPVEVPGAGPITANRARAILSETDAPIWLRRVFTDPVDGSVAMIDPRRRRFAGPLRDLVGLADQHCRGINCTARIRDIDHVVPYGAGGSTILANAQGLSRGCHTNRHSGRTTVTTPHPDLDPGGRLTVWTTRSGLTYRSIPPPALGYGSATPRQQRFRHWLRHPPDSLIEQLLIARIARHLRTSNDGMRDRSAARAVPDADGTTDIPNDDATNSDERERPG